MLVQIFLFISSDAPHHIRKQPSENGETPIKRSLLSTPAQDTDRPDLGGQQQLLEAGDVFKKVEEKSRKKGMCQRSREPVAPPHFCSKHQRWARNILQQCPDECSEELLLQANPSSSPPLFYSSSSTSSSQDLTPSDLFPGPLDQPPPSQADQHGLASTTSQKEAVPQPPLPRDGLLSPATRNSRPSANHSIVPSDRVTSSCCRCHISADKHSVFSPPQIVHLPNQTSGREPTTSQPFPRLFREHRGPRTNARHLQAPRASDEKTFEVNRAPSFSDNASVHAVCSVTTLVPLSTDLCHPLVPQNSSTCHPEAPVHMLHSTDVVSNTGHLTMRHDSEVSTAAMRRPVLRQAVVLQPYVTLTRLSSRQCRRITKGRCCDHVAQPTREEEDTDSSFDPSTLYSSQSSSSFSMDLTNDDPDYKPCIKKKSI